jgi:hypothetical protein
LSTLPADSHGNSSHIRPDGGATFAARAPVVVVRRKTIDERAGVHFGTSGLCSYVRPCFAARSRARRGAPPRRLYSRVWPRSSCLVSGPDHGALGASPPRFYKTSRKEKSVHFRRSAHCLSDGPKDSSRRKVCPLSRLAPLFLRGPSRKLPSARRTAVAPVAWAPRQGLSAPSPSGTHRVLRLNKKVGRIWPARTTEGQMNNFIEIEGEVKRAGRKAGFVPAAGRAVAPGVGPQVASISLQSGPIPHRSADRGVCVLPTYLRHPRESA